MHNAIDRRKFLLGLFASAAAASSTRAFAVAPDSGLRTIADAKGISFGSAVDGKFLKDEAYAAQLKRECNMIVPRNGLKWSATERRPGSFGFGEADQILKFAESNGMSIRGHTLVWHNVPDWVKAIDSEKDMQAALVGHVETVAGRYAGEIASWDVVNEPLEYDTAELRDSPFLKQLGETYVDLAFTEARRADPQAQLVLNETHLCKTGEAYAERRALMLKLIDGLQARNIPIDAVGIQGHFRPGFDGLDIDGFGAFCRELKTRGLAVLITELDASCRFEARVAEVTEQTYAQPFHDLISIAASEGNLTAVILWGLTARGMKPSEPEGPNPACKVRVNLYDSEDNVLPTRAAVQAALEAL
jgi:endo-1,4-beta-xylanase